MLEARASSDCSWNHHAEPGLLRWGDGSRIDPEIHQEPAQTGERGGDPADSVQRSQTRRSVGEYTRMNCKNMVVVEKKKTHHHLWARRFLLLRALQDCGANWIKSGEIVVMWTGL